MLCRNPKKLPYCLAQSLLNLNSDAQISEAVSSLEHLAQKGIRLPSKTLALLLHRCGDTKSLREGKLIHLHLKLTGLKCPNTILSNNLIYMYFRCGKDSDALKVFDKMSARNLYSWNNMLSGYAKLGMITRARVLFDQMPEKDVVSWNTMVIGHAQNGMCYEALKFYKELRRLPIGYNEFSFAGVLTVCVKMKEAELTRQIHGQVLVSGFLLNLVLSSSIIDAYSKHGEMSSARKLFDEMMMKDILVWTTLISGYTKWGDMESAKEIFNMMPEKNPVSWTALIAGYARNGPVYKSLELFTKMMELRIKPDQFTYSSCLCSSSAIASLKHGKQIHGHLIRTNFKSNTIVISSLIDMYSKCGSLEIGKLVFDLTNSKQDPILWNTMISGFAQHGHGKDAISMFDDMVESGCKPDRVTLVVILNACSHSGLVQDGVRYFERMSLDYNVVPDQEHYACLVDLLGRAGRFNELLEVVSSMPFEPDERVWKAVLGVCRIHGNIELGRKAAEQLIAMEPQSSGPYVLLSSIYGTLGKWGLVEDVRMLMDTRRVKKEKAISWINVENKVHVFAVSDRLHPLHEEIYSVLEQIGGLIEQDYSNRLIS